MAEVRIPAVLSHVDYINYIRNVVANRHWMLRVNKADESSENDWKIVEFTVTNDLISASIHDPAWEEMRVAITETMEDALEAERGKESACYIYLKTTMVDSEDRRDYVNYVSAPFHEAVISGVERRRRVNEILRVSRKNAAAYKKQYTLWFVKILVSVRFYKVPRNVVFENGAEKVSLFGSR